MLVCFEKYKLMWKRRIKTSQTKIQTNFGRNTKTLQKEIQIDVERNTNGCGPSYQPAADGGWMVAATSHKTNTKGKILRGKFQNNSQANYRK